MTAESDARDPIQTAVPGRFVCERCGAELAYAPGTTRLACAYCAHVNEIEAGSSAVEELDYRQYLARLLAAEPTRDVSVVKCRACGAETERPPNLDAFACVFCGADMLAGATSGRIIKPRSLLPFAITRERAHATFRSWIATRWFAPTRLKRFARSGGRLDGVYIPFWTYDALAISDYRGQRGEHYWVTETYTTTENGKPVTRTRQVQRTRWHPAEGTVETSFDDILVCGSHSLPRAHMDKLAPWDLAQLVPYTDEYVAGFEAEKYQVGLEDGFVEAKEKMQGTIQAAIRADIGGDVQRILDVETRYPDITFKHMLLPVWISAYRFRNQVFRLTVNARTGELLGDRPYSAWKIALTVIAAVAAVGLIALMIALAQ